MVSKEKMIQKIIKKAVEVNEVNIPEEHITDVELEDFYNAKGEIFYNKDILYRKTENMPIAWLRLSLKGISEEKSEEILPIIENKDELKEIKNWTHSFKKYVDKKFDSVKKQQDEFFKEIKEYIDNKNAKSK